MKNKITFLMLHLNYGGLEKQTTLLINSLAKKGYDIEIVSVYKILDKPFYTLNENVKIKYLLDYGPNKDIIKIALKNKQFFKVLKECIKGIKIVYLKYSLLRKEIKKLDTDIIFSTRSEFSNLIYRQDTLNISQEHSYIDDNKYFMKLKKYFKNINKVVVMTSKAKEEYSKYITNDVVVIPNIIEENTSGYSLLNNNQITAIGRLEDVKNFDNLIKMFKTISDKYPNYILKIIGEGSLKSRLQELIVSLKLEGKIILTGRYTKEQIDKELLNTDIFCSTSKSESFSLVICDAMNHGIPVIAFDVDTGPREIITNNQDGFLVEFNNEEEYINKIITLIEDDKLRSKIGNNSKISITKYYESNIIEKWINILKVEG